MFLNMLKRAAAMVGVVVPPAVRAAILLAPPALICAALWRMYGFDYALLWLGVWGLVDLYSGKLGAFLHGSRKDNT